MRKGTLAFGTCCIAAIALAGASLYSQQPTKTVKVNVDLVLVNATVTNEEGRYVTDLARDNFQIWEDKIGQKIEYFSTEDVPVSVGIIFDSSGSMTSWINSAHLAAETFLETGYDKGTTDDEYFIVEFNTRAQLTVDFTSDISKLKSHIMFIPPKGTTALYDALYLGMTKVKKGKNSKKALLLISDGGENHSRYSRTDLREFVREENVQIFVIGSAGEGASPLVAMTGGTTSYPRTDSFADISRKIAIELKNQYIIGYRPTNAARDGRWRKIRLQVTPPAGVSHLDVRGKEGYYAAE